MKLENNEQNADETNLLAIILLSASMLTIFISFMGVFKLKWFRHRLTLDQPEAQSESPVLLRTTSVTEVRENCARGVYRQSVDSEALVLQEKPSVSPSPMRPKNNDRQIFRMPFRNKLKLSRFSSHENGKISTIQQSTASSRISLREHELEMAQKNENLKRKIHEKLHPSTSISMPDLSSGRNNESESSVQTNHQTLTKIESSSRNFSELNHRQPEVHYNEVLVDSEGHDGMTQSPPSNSNAMKASREKLKLDLVNETVSENLEKNSPRENSESVQELPNEKSNFNPEKDEENMFSNYVIREIPIDSPEKFDPKNTSVESQHSTQDPRFLSSTQDYEGSMVQTRDSEAEVTYAEVIFDNSKPGSSKILEHPELDQNLEATNNINHSLSRLESLQFSLELPKIEEVPPQKDSLSQQLPDILVPPQPPKRRVSNRQTTPKMIEEAEQIKAPVPKKRQSKEDLLDLQKQEIEGASVSRNVSFDEPPPVKPRTRRLQSPDDSNADIDLSSIGSSMGRLKLGSADPVDLKMDSSVYMETAEKFNENSSNASEKSHSKIKDDVEKSSHSNENELKTQSKYDSGSAESESDEDIDAIVREFKLQKNFQDLNKGVEKVGDRNEESLQNLKKDEVLSGFDERNEEIIGIKNEELYENSNESDLNASEALSLKAQEVSTLEILDASSKEKVSANIISISSEISQSVDQQVQPKSILKNSETSSSGPKTLTFINVPESVSETSSEDEESDEDVWNLVDQHRFHLSRKKPPPLPKTPPPPLEDDDYEHEDKKHFSFA